MSGSHLCPRCGGWHAVGGQCHATPAPGSSFGLTRSAGRAPAPARRHDAMVAAQAEADAAEAVGIAVYLQRFRGGAA